MERSNVSQSQIAVARRQVVQIMNGANDGIGKLQELCDMLREVVAHYDWVGFYFALRDTETLVLGPFAGEPTEHNKIGFGVGICGQAAERQQTIVVSDVQLQTNYLACSMKVQAEIVVPVFRNSRVLAEIDIDSHRKDPFTDEDRTFLEQLAGMVEPLIPDNFPE